MSTRKHYDVRYIGTQKQLFIDDYIIESMNNVQKVLNQPEKYPGNPIVKMDQPWEVGTYKWPIGRNMTEEEMRMADKQGPLYYVTGSIEYDKEEDIYKMWCQIGSYLLSEQSLCYLTSKDGIHWDKPTLGLVKYRGYETNILLEITPTSRRFGPRGIYTQQYKDKGSGRWTGIDGPCVFKDPVATNPDRRYKMLYHIMENGNYAILCEAFSPDGIHWTPWEGNPIGRSDAQDTVYWDYKNQKYMACPRCFSKPNNLYLYEDPPIGIRVVGQIESTDFEHWSDKVPIVKADEQDGPFDRQFYHMQVMQYEGVYIGFLGVFHIVPEYEQQEKLEAKRMDNLDVQLTFSRDGRAWMRAGDRGVFIANSPNKGSYDYGLIWALQEPLPVIIDDEIYIYYTGQPGLHWYYSRGEAQEGSVCLARLRLDGFVSLDALDKGTLTTKPFPVVEGSDVRGLEINSKTAKQGFVSVEVLDLHGRPIPGFTKDNCDAFSGDEVRHTVTWNGKTDMGRLKGKVVRLRFYLGKAKLFSFRLLR